MADRLIPAYAPHFVRCLALAMRLTGWSRAAETGLLDRILDLLVRPESHPSASSTLQSVSSEGGVPRGRGGRSTSDGGPPALFEGFRSPDSHVTRACFRVALDLQGVARGAAVEAALRHHDPEIRLRGARAALARFQGAERRAVLERLRRDRSVRIRRAALYAYLESSSAPDQTVARDFLLDPHPDLRWAARLHFRPPGEMDFPAFYRKALALPDPRFLAGAAGGLGEVGQPEDAPSSDRSSTTSERGCGPQRSGEWGGWTLPAARRC